MFFSGDYIGVQPKTPWLKCAARKKRRSDLLRPPCGINKFAGLFLVFLVDMFLDLGE